MKLDRPRIFTTFFPTYIFNKNSGLTLRNFKRYIGDMLFFGYVSPETIVGREYSMVTRMYNQI